MSASSVGTYTQIPDFITDSEEYKALDYSVMASLTYLLKSMTRDNNGMLSFPVSVAESIGMDNKTRRQCLHRLTEAGIILKTARYTGTTPDMYAVFWRPFKPSNDEARLKTEAFWEWANRQRKYFQKYLTGDEIPRGLEQWNLPLTGNEAQCE